ncbi:sulfatase [Seongchinamella unica]|uniref:Sulfatase n=1 Tax=Seongchinamella unica TaxID=2547392 RepID=A0A4R5LN50_9GAMM|nr:sulfatase-like hydrolase/transferase [Seongchinamella unica]TDG11590.1 sulfatase [Seongchinamella unica]
MPRACWLLSLLLLAGCSADGPSTGASAGRPNILLILADDLGNNDLGAFGDGSAVTPHLDALAAAGVRFRRHYAQPSCRPARVELLTGKAASRVGVPPHFRGIGPEHVTLAEALRDGGYATAHIGKWHLGHGVGSAEPGSQGFDDWYGFLHALTTRYGSLARPAASYIDPWLQRAGQPPVQHKGHLTDLLTDAAIERIDRLGEGARPWFLNLWYFAPHNPVQAAPRFAGRFPDSPEGEYLSLLAQLDEAVGRLLQALADSGQLENTLLVFASDNGGVNRVRDSNKPFYGKKTTFYEGGIRTPLILSQAGRLAPMDIEQPVFIRDLMPTLLAYAGLPAVEDLDGLDLGPLLHGESLPRPPRVYWDIDIPEWGAYGVLDLQREQLGLGVEVQERASGENYFAPPRPATPREQTRIRDEYHQWQSSIRRVEVQSASGSQGSREYAGDSYRRTPGYGGWTLQLPVRTDRPYSRLVAQEQQLDIHLGGAQLALQIPGVELQSQLPGAGCQLLTVSAYYQWPARRVRDAEVHLRVYLDDELLASGRESLVSTVLEDSYAPTRVAADSGELLISNTYLDNNPTAHYRALTGGEAHCPP